MHWSAPANHNPLNNIVMTDKKSKSYERMISSLLYQIEGRGAQFLSELRSKLDNESLKSEVSAHYLETKKVTETIKEEFEILKSPLSESNHITLLKQERKASLNKLDNSKSLENSTGGTNIHLLLGEKAG